MSSPMEVTLQSAAPETSAEASGQPVLAPESSKAPISQVSITDKVLVSVEVCLNPSSTARAEDVRRAVERMLEKRSLSYVDGPVPVPLDDSFLLENVKQILICDTDELVDNHKVLLFWQVRPVVHVFQVAKLFQKIQEMVEDENSLVFVLIDEVESLAAARQASLSGSEPSDSIRVVNALLTQMDKLKNWPNVIILTTSNITTAIDIAFVDRADIKAYVGPPTLQARYEILRSCIQELVRAGILACSQDHDNLLLPNYSTLKEKLHSSEIGEHQGSLHLSRLLLEAAEACEGLSGRALRKLPFLTHAAVTNHYICDPRNFLCTLIETARREISELRA